MTTTILWRPEINSLTTPQSYRPRHVARGTAGYDELAAGIAARNPIYNEGLGKGYMLEMREEIKQQLLNGNQVSLEGLFTCHISLSGRLDTPDDPLPPPEESLHVKLYASKRLVTDVRKDASLEREAQEKKLPLIATARDTLFKLSNVLNPAGVLQLTGENLSFDEEKGTGECVLEGTESGRMVQTSLVMVTNSMIILVPDIPAQTNPWNNEYRVSVTTHYTEHGTPRTGTCERLLRTPLVIEGISPETGAGILTGSAAAPYVRVTDAIMSGDARLRIQVLQDLAEERLLFSLLDMKEEGAEGAEVVVSGNGEYTLPGFAGSAVAQLMITVDSYTGLWDMVRNDYGGMLVDILDITAA